MRKQNEKRLIDEISKNLQLELNGLVAQQYTKIKHEIKSMYDKKYGETIKDTEKKKSYFKGELSSVNQLVSNLRNKKFNVLHTRRCISMETNRGI